METDELREVREQLHDLWDRCRRVDGWRTAVIAKLLAALCEIIDEWV